MTVQVQAERRQIVEFIQGWSFARKYNRRREDQEGVYKRVLLMMYMESKPHRSK